MPGTQVDLLRGVSLFAGLTDGQLADLAARLQARTYPARSIVFHQHEPGRALFVIVDGKVRVFLASDTGQEMTVDILTQGEVFGEMALFGVRVRSASVTTLTRTQLLMLDRDDFYHVLRAVPDIGIRMLEVLSDRLRATTAYAAEMAFSDLPGRTARVLLALAERHGVPDGSGVRLDVNLTQSELASLVGTTRESMNRILGVLRDHGLVALDGPRVTILDPAALRRITVRGPSALEV